jgi:hypothetical protein
VAQEPKAKPPPKTRKAAEKPQRERFIETAREIGVDETGDEFMRLLHRVVPAKRRKHESE